MSEQNHKIRIGIVGYGNLGRGVEMALTQNTDMELVAIFTRRETAQIETPNPVVSYSRIKEFRDKIDVMILCGGSATDLPKQGPEIAQWFHTVDSYDNHGKIPDYFAAVDSVAKENSHVSLISTGWDPGLFSILRTIGLSVLPSGETYTFWGKGVSQGHSDAIRRIEGVKNAVQYTVPKEEALKKVREGENPHLETSDKHERECFVVAEDNADLIRIENTIKTMPNYFAPYRTIVHFISEEEFHANHSGMPHGGKVFRTGTTGIDTKQRIEFGLQLASNPEFTSSVMVAFARAVYQLIQQKQFGAKTVLDIPVGYLSPISAEELRRTIL